MAGHLARRALVASLRIKRWPGTMIDKAVTSEVETAKNAKKGSGSFSKRLFNKSTLSKMNAIAQRIRDEHRHLTLPWNDSGDRLLPINKHQDYKKRLGTMIDEFMGARSDFVKNYEHSVKEEVSRLGDLYNVGDYPTVDEIKEKFEITLGFTPVPDASHFVADCGDDERDRIRKEMEQEIEGRIRSANTNLFERLQEAVEGIAKRLEPGEEGKPTAIRDAALTNLTDLLGTIESLNLTDNTLIQRVCGEIRDTFDGVVATELREKSRKFDPDKYNKVRNKMESLKEQFSGYFGEPEPTA